MPLMGNPTAAVLYPGKLIFALVPYPLAARLYVVGHTLLAYVTMFAMLRSWRTSLVGSALAASSYAFGAPVLATHEAVVGDQVLIDPPCAEPEVALGPNQLSPGFTATGPTVAAGLWIRRRVGSYDRDLGRARAFLRAGGRMGWF
jgi:hypothetical protein